MATIQVGAYGVNTSVFSDILTPSCGNKDIVVHLNTWSNGIQQLYMVLAQCSDNVNFTLDQREAMAETLFSISTNVILECNSFLNWCAARAKAAPGHGLWGNDDSCNKRRNWWYENPINTLASMRGAMIAFQNACQIAKNLISDEEQSEYQEELWEDELIANDIANGNQIILLQAAAEKANERSNANRIQQIIVPGILITVGYLLFKKKSQ